MDLKLSPLQKVHQAEVMNIFNYYVENSFSAFFTFPLPHECFDSFLESCKNYPAYAIEDHESKAVGFGLLKPFHPGDALRRTAELSYFISPAFTGKGLGGMLFNKLTQDAKEIGVDNLIASVSSKNEQSLNFHKKKGFEVAGNLKQVGLKFGQDFDVVLFQRNI